MSSLVMLTVMPLLNNNNSFSNTAMAQGYDDEDGSYNSYNGDSKDSTKNKLYECKTGPFKGFVVSSVEFCKRSLHVDGNGASPLAINDTNLYTVVGDTLGVPFFPQTGGAGPIPVVPPRSATVSSIATCDAGDFALGGSFVVTGNSIVLTGDTGQPPFAVNIIKSSNPLDSNNGWNATALLSGVPGFSGKVTADAVCFDNPPLRP